MSKGLGMNIRFVPVRWDILMCILIQMTFSNQMSKWEELSVSL